MALCAHQYWLCVHQGENRVELQYTNRLYHILTSLPDPTKQHLSLLFFIGKQFKGRALYALFPNNTILNCQKYSLANIYVNLAIKNNKYPILIADSCLDYTQVKLRGKYTCYKTTNHQVAWLDKSDQQKQQQQLGELVIARLLLLFIDIFCIFAQDCGSLNRVIDIVAM